MTLEQKLNRIPPCIARLLAKHNGRLMTTDELKRRTGFGHMKLKHISKQKTWARVAVEDVDIFLQACGLSWSAQRRQRWLLELAIKKGRLHKMRHFKTSNRIEAAQVHNHLRKVERLFSDKGQQ
jgi:hypothetical protein